jgi:hypothetical protein
MITDPLTLTVTGNDFVVTKSGTGNFVSTWVDTTPPTGARREMTIRHQRVGKPNAAGSVNWRHLVQFRHLQFNEDLGKDEVITANFTIVAPTTSDITSDSVTAMFEVIGAFLATSGFPAKLLRNEI